MEMLNKAVLNDLRDAGMASPQAEVVALHIPDWKQFATGQDLKEVKQEIKEVKQELKQEIKTLRWFMVAGLILLSALSDRAAAPCKNARLPCRALFSLGQIKQPPN